MSKHTKGPWIWVKDSLMQCDGDNYSPIRENRVICQLSSESKLNTENARLIASAPELLEQVKYALKFCRDEGIDPTWECALEKVIAKAEGN